MRRARRARPRRRAGARAGALPRDLPPRRRRARRRDAKTRLAEIIERLATLGTAFSQNVLADEQGFALCSTTRPILPACRISCAKRMKAEAQERGTGRPRRHAVALERRAVPAILRAPRPARKGVPRLDRARRQRRRDRQQGDHRRDGGAARRARAAARLRRLSPTTGSTTRWRRRRPPCATCSDRCGRRRASARSPTATPCRRWCRRRAAISRSRRGTGATTPRSCASAAAISTRRRSSPISQLDRMIEAAFYTADRLFGLRFERAHGRSGLASGRARLGGARRGRRPSRPVLRRLFRAPLEAQRRLDDVAARPGEARRRHPAADRQCHEFRQGRRTASRRC